MAGRKFKTSPLAITEEAERAAKEVLCSSGQDNSGPVISPPGPFFEVWNKTSGGNFMERRGVDGPIVERQILEAVLTIIRVSEDDDNMLILLVSELEDYAVPSYFYHGNINGLVQQLPITLKAVDTAEDAESLDTAEDAESLDTAEDAESLDTAEDAESLDTESLDLIEATESLDVENTEA
ncbi:unnamed protein product [Leuciscus chuanchicus]